MCPTMIEKGVCIKETKGGLVWEGRKENGVTGKEESLETTEVKERDEIYDLDLPRWFTH